MRHVISDGGDSGQGSAPLRQQVRQAPQRCQACDRSLLLFLKLQDLAFTVNGDHIGVSDEYHQSDAAVGCVFARVQSLTTLACSGGEPWIPYTSREQPRLPRQSWRDILKSRETTPVEKGCDDAGSFEKARLALNAFLDFVRTTRSARAWRPEKPIDRIKKIPAFRLCVGIVDVRPA